MVSKCQASIPSSAIGFRLVAAGSFNFLCTRMCHIIRILAAILAFNMQAAMYAQSVSEGYSNSVLPGFHPDPSVCRVGDGWAGFERFSMRNL